MNKNYIYNINISILPLKGYFVLFKKESIEYRVKKEKKRCKKVVVSFLSSCPLKFTLTYLLKRLNIFYNKKYLLFYYFFVVSAL